MEPTTWQPIETALRNGDVILTENGIATWFERDRQPGWYLCFIGGCLIIDFAGGLCFTRPKWWISIPPIPA